MFVEVDFNKFFSPNSEESYFDGVAVFRDDILGVDVEKSPILDSLRGVWSSLSFVGSDQIKMMKIQSRKVVLCGVNDEFIEIYESVRGAGCISLKNIELEVYERDNSLVNLVVKYDQDDHAEEVQYLINAISKAVLAKRNKM